MGVGFVSSGLCAHKHCSDLLSVSHEHLSLSTGASNFRSSTGRHLDSGWDCADCDCLDKNPDHTGTAAAMDLVCLDPSLRLGHRVALFDQGSRNAADSSPSAGTAAPTSSYMGVYHANRGSASLGMGGDLRPCSRWYFGMEYVRVFAWHGVDDWDHHRLPRYSGQQLCSHREFLDPVRTTPDVTVVRAFAVCW